MPPATAPDMRDHMPGALCAGRKCRWSSGRSRSWLDLLEQAHGLRRHALTACQRAEPLQRLALHVYGARLEPDERGDRRPHPRALWCDPRALGRDHDVDVHGPEARLLHAQDDFLQERGAGRVLPARVRIGEQRAEVVQSSRAEQRVGDRVQDRVAVRVTERSARMIERDPAEHARPSTHQSMHVEADPDTDAHVRWARARTMACAISRSWDWVSLRFTGVPATIATGPT